MRSTVYIRLVACAAAIVTIACGKAPNDRTPEPGTSRQASPSSAPIVERDWALVTLRESAAPPGSGGKPATIRFDSAAHRAAGFAGCNRYSAPYTMAGDSLHFGPAISTKMACAEGDSLERAFLGIIADVATFQSTDSSLVLTGASGALARFRAQ